MADCKLATVSLIYLIIVLMIGCFHVPARQPEQLSPPSSPEAILARSFEERVQRLFEKCGIWRPDPDLYQKAEFLLDLCDEAEGETDIKPIISEHAYCRQKIDFLLDLADPDAEFDEKYSEWKRTADKLLPSDDEEPGALELSHINRYIEHRSERHISGLGGSHDVTV